MTSIFFKSAKFMLLWASCMTAMPAIAQSSGDVDARLDRLEALVTKLIERMDEKEQQITQGDSALARQAQQAVAETRALAARTDKVEAKVEASRVRQSPPKSPLHCHARIDPPNQANCRATLEALGKLHQPREQIVKHVHVNQGGQAVVADQFHQHQGEGKNGKSSEQSHTTETTGESRTLLGQDAEGNGMPIPCSEGPEKVPNARRDESGSAEG